MANNVVLPGTGKSVATIEKGSDHHQQVLAGFLTASVVTEVTSAVGLPVNVLASAAIALAAGSQTIGKLAANSGIDIGDVDVLSLPISYNEGVPGAAVVRMVQAINQLNFNGDSAPPIDSVSSITTSAAISCENKSLIYLGPEYSDSAGTAPLLIILRDHNGTQKPAPGGIVTPANLGFQGQTIETGYYSGEGVWMPTYGAKEFNIMVFQAPSAGSVSVFPAVI